MANIMDLVAQRSRAKSQSGYSAQGGGNMADYSSFVNAGLSGANSLISNQTNPAMPAYTGGNKVNPYAVQQTANGMQGSGYEVGKGVYGGIGRDAASIRKDYQGAVDQSWNKSLGQIKNMYGANGLYGSMGGGLMSGVANDAAQNYATASAQGRLTADQAIMADEIARANSYRDAYQLQGNQNLDQWKAGMQTTDYNNQLLGNRVNFGNSQIDAAYQDALARRNDQKAFDQLKIENYLGLAGGSSPSAAAQMQANAAKKASDAQNTGAWLGALGDLGGGLLSGVMKSGGWGSLFSW